jgi:hypothetical protein
MNYLERTAKNSLFTTYQAKVDGDQDINPGPLADKIEHKIAFQWKDYDRSTLDQIKSASAIASNEILGHLLRTVDSFYATFRAPRVRASGATVLDANGRIVFERDENDRYIEDFSALTGQDVEEAILKLQRDKIDAAQRINDLFLEALFAKHIYDDEYNARYEALLDGTINDRSARANRDTKQAKYFAFFKFYTYQQCDVLFAEVSNLLRILERVRQWRVSDSYARQSG